MAAWRRPVEAFRKWWSQKSASKRERWRLAAVLVVLALLLLVIVFALWRTAALTALFLAPVALCLIVLGLLGPNAREWLIEHVIPIGALLLSGWLLGAFGLWAVVNTVWAGQARPPAQDHAPLTVAGVPLTATAAYPAVALADAADDTLTLSFSAGAVPLPRQYVTATVTLPATLAFAAAGGPPTRDFLVPLTAGQPGSRRIGIVNSGVYGGWRGREETIAVRLCADPDNCTADDLTLIVRPEGRDGYAIRRFVNSTIDQSSPIILLLLFLVPGLAVWGQRAVDKWQVALQQQKQAKFELRVKEFRERFCAENLDGAEEVLDQLDSASFSEWNTEPVEIGRALLQVARLDFPLDVSTEEPRAAAGETGQAPADHAPTKLELADAENVAGDDSSKSNTNNEIEKWIKAHQPTLRKGQRWPREYAEAYCQARQTLKQARLDLDQAKKYLRPPQNSKDGHWHLESVRQVLRKSNSESVTSPLVDNEEVEASERELDKLGALVQRARYNIQYQHFADDPTLDVKLASWASDYSEDIKGIESRRSMVDLHPRRAFVEGRPPDLPSFNGRPLEFPFARFDARDREEQFFLRDCLNDSPVILPDQLTSTLAGSLILHGARGCGRTATSICLHGVGLDPDRLLVRLAGPLRPPSIAIRVVQQFQRFMLGHPTYLLNYGPDQRRFLARLLVTYLGNHVAASIEQAQARVESNSFLNKGDRYILARQQLEEFKRIVTLEMERPSALQQSRERNPFSAPNWYRPLEEGARILDFSEVVFTYDCQGSERWVADQLLPNLESWSLVGVAFYLFMPTEQFNRLTLDSALVQARELCWDKEPFEKMLDWRYKGYLRHQSQGSSAIDLRLSEPIRSCFKDFKDGFHQLVEGSLIDKRYNPRRFMQLWCTAAEGKQVGGQIGKEDVERAFKAILGPKYVSPALPAPPSTKSATPVTPAKPVEDESSPPSFYVERDPSIDTLYRWVVGLREQDEAHLSYDARLLSILGPPGSGKTALLHRLQHRLAASKLAIIWLDVQTDARSLDSLNGWLMRQAKELTGKPDIPRFIIDRTVSFQALSDAFLMHLLAHMGARRIVLLIDSFDKNGYAQWHDIEWFLASAARADNVRIVLARRDEAALGDGILRYAEMVIPLGPLSEPKEQIRRRLEVGGKVKGGWRREEWEYKLDAQIAGLTKEQKDAAINAVQAHLTTNPYINVRLLSSWLENPSTPMSIHKRTCLEHYLMYAGLDSSYIDALKRLVHKSSIDGSFTSDQYGGVGHREEMEQLVALMVAGMVSSISRTARYQLDPAVIKLL